MKNILLFIFLFFMPGFLFAQNKIPQTNQKVAPSDTIVPAKGDPKEQLKDIKEEKVKQLSDTTGNQPKKTALVDTTVQNKYGDLLKDDSLYNKKYPLWIPLVEVLSQNSFVFSMDRFLFKYDFATSVGTDSWKHNINTGWE